MVCHRHLGNAILFFGNRGAGGDSTGRKRPPPFHAYLTGDEPLKRLGIKASFGLLDPFVQGRGGVVGEHGHGFLGDDGAGVDALVDEMDGASGELDAVVELPISKASRSPIRRRVRATIPKLRLLPPA